MSFQIARHLHCRRALIAVATALLSSSVLGSFSVSAADVAYWRHEEGTAGQIVADGANTVVDSSLNGNHMQTYASGRDPFTAATYTTKVSPLSLRSGLPNTLSLDFGPNPTGFTDDGGGLNDDNYTADKTIQSYLFNSMTIELAFNMNSVGGWQAIFGKDGKPIGDSPVPPLKFLIRNDDFPDAVPNQLFIEWIDGNSVVHHLATRETVVAGEWNHVAFTLSATDAQLWVAGETGGYALKDSITGTFAGPGGDVLFPDPTSYTVGRGMFNNGVTDWADAVIDEVRISDAILTPEQFLFDTAAVAEDGDFNNDNIVDGADFLIWQRGFGPTGTNLTGDADDNGVVDGADLTIWKSQFGGAPATAVAAAVPEPTTVALGGLAVVVMGLVSRRR